MGDFHRNGIHSVPPLISETKVLLYFFFFKKFKEVYQLKEIMTECQKTGLILKFKHF